jgi:hypothetical protein
MKDRSPVLIQSAMENIMENKQNIGRKCQYNNVPHGEGSQ